MDCEKFDEDVMDALYGELPELSEAALRRHVESCSRCASAYASLKSVREGAVLPLVEPSSELEERILAAEKMVYGRAPWHRKVVRAAAWAGSHAMRPQLAMAALFMFVIGSSLLLLRARPGTVAAPVSVEQQGSPELARADKQPSEGFAGRPAGASRTLDDRAESERGTGKDGARPSDAAKSDAAPAATAEAAASANALTAPPSAADGAAAALAAAKTARERDGCAAATPQLESIVKTYAGTPEGRAATDELSLCAQGVGGAGSMAKSAALSPAKPGAPATATATTTAAPTVTVPPGPR